MITAATTVYAGLLASPVGELTVLSDGQRLTGLYLPGHRRGPVADPSWARDDGAFAAAREQLTAYFAGRLRAFDLPLAPAGTPFQQRVWQALRAIPYGATESYRGLAARLGDPRAVRAVAAAVGRNPLSIVVPCHRVIGADGSLVGYAGGLETKRLLLRLEAGG
jgi:methylated-DNA-[protein]-cysteine S-methyltransferase